MKRLKYGICVLVFALIASLLLSCGGSGAPDSQLTEALRALEPKARELYGIVYGDTLPHGEEAEGLYYKVSEDALYQSVEELKAAMGEVFTPAYSKVLCNTAFETVSLDDGTTIHSKFMTKEDGLYVNPFATEDFGRMRTFDFESVAVVKKNPYRATLSVKAAGEDGTIEELEVNLQKVNGIWLLDSPLF